MQNFRIILRPSNIVKELKALHALHSQIVPHLASYHETARDQPSRGNTSEVINIGTKRSVRQFLDFA